MPGEDVKWYPSKVDWWFKAVTVLLAIIVLAVFAGKGYIPTVMISPDNKSDFLSALARRSGLRQEGERLVKENLGKHE